MEPASARARKARQLLLSVAVFVGLAAMAHFAVVTERARMVQNLRLQVSQQAIGLAARLEAELNANAFLANGMFTFVTAVRRATDREFNDALKAMARFGRHVRNVGLAPDNRLRYIYPLAGNEAALGLYYPDLPAQWPQVKRAIDLRTTILAGPVELRQGGSGLISRTPVFLEDGSYWGILSVVLDTGSLLKAAGLEARSDGVLFALRGRDGSGAAGEAFFGDAAVFAGDSVRLTVSVPGGSWQLAAMPERGWASGQGYLAVLEAAALIGALFAAWATYSYQRGRVRIETSERRMRAFMETARDGVIVMDEAGGITEFNRAAETLFGYRAGEVVGTSIDRLMPDLGPQLQTTETPGDGGVLLVAGGLQMEGRRQDGESFPAEITVGDTLIGGRRIHVGVVRDITERKAFERQLIELANTDGLTGALSRRAFFAEARSLCLLARRHSRALSCLIVDADRFKSINDNYGHHVGDLALVQLATVARDCLRASDLFGRLGGEEFAILLPESDRDHAESVADRLLNAVRAASIVIDAGKALKFTVSIGVATLSEDTPDIEALIRRADSALYEAKAAGRDRRAVA